MRYLRKPSEFKARMISDMTITNIWLTIMELGTLKIYQGAF